MAETLTDPNLLSSPFGSQTPAASLPTMTAPISAYSDFGSVPTYNPVVKPVASYQPFLLSPPGTGVSLPQTRMPTASRSLLPGAIDSGLVSYRKIGGLTVPQINDYGVFSRLPGTDQIALSKEINDESKGVTAPAARPPFYQEGWFWQTLLSGAALAYQIRADREARKTQLELYNQQLDITERHRKEDHAQQVAMMQMQSSLRTAESSANKGGAVVRGGY